MSSDEYEAKPEEHRELASRENLTEDANASTEGGESLPKSELRLTDGRDALEQSASGVSSGQAGEVRGSATGGEAEASPAIDGLRISRKVARLFELVPAIGTGWRWYDFPYRFLDWLAKGTQGRPRLYRIRVALFGGINFLMAFEHHARLKVEPLDDPMENLVLPSGERIIQGGLWVVDFFPPSHYSNLLESLDKSGWDRKSVTLGADGTNAEQVTHARQGDGFSWRRMGYVARPNSGYLGLNQKVEDLPKEFDLIEVSAVQVGRGLTAIIAFVRLSDFGQRRLDSAWRARREPTLEWRGLRRPHVQGRLFTAFQATQAERKRMHDLGRKWLASRCAGFFAGTDSGQPVMDLLAFKKFDPLVDEEDRLMGDSLRALGLDAVSPYVLTSPQLPGAVLAPPPSLVARGSGLGNCWALVGREATLSALNERPGHGSAPHDPTAVAGMLNETMRSLSIYLAARQYVRELKRLHAISVDRARSDHRKFSAKRVEQLRSEFLTTSLDLSMVARDMTSIWSEEWTYWNGVSVFAQMQSKWRRSSDLEIDVIADWGESQKAALSELLDDNRVYREVLAATSSLGASAETSRLGRRALVTSMGSLVVAVVALLVANTSGETLLSRLLDFIQR